MSEPYVPQLGIVYPEKPDDRMVAVKAVRDIKIDENYPFLDRSFKFRIRRFFLSLTIFFLVFPLNHLRYGIKIKGKNILRKHKKLFNKGAMTVSNHVHRWDFLFVMHAIRYRTMYFPAWKEHLKGPDADLIRLAGGIPIPDDIHTIRCFNSAFDEIHKMKKWIHAFPESTRFDYFQPIRPFKKGVFTLAFRYDLPVIPFAISYRKTHFPHTLINRSRDIPLITVNIGEPLLFDKNLSRRENIEKMRKNCHEAVVDLAGIRDNPYEAEGD